MRYYSKDHEWLYIVGDTGEVGITNHAQNQLGDIVFCEAEPPGTALAAGEAAGAVESVKAASDILTPVSGEIIAVNPDPQREPSLLNSAPEETWVFRIRLSDPAELAGLLDEGAYSAFCDE
ncbi:MAG: glycine cleavage system protein GcvH [Oscillospiraceae bacterium]|nr:glycine cleavage system protein GcvH [Oscillospiraceae bacterium]